MGKQIRYIAPVDSVSGMFGKRKDSLSGKAIISNVRRKPSQKYPGGHMYMSVLTKTTYSNGLVLRNWREKFAQICSATRIRLISPSQSSQDKVAFRQQTYYKTLYSYVWNQVRESIETQG